MKEVTQLVESDVLVIGGGIAGCLVGIAAKQTLGEDGTVVVVDKARIGRSGQSAFAAGIFTVFDPAEDDLDEWMIASALIREESRGFHFRDDFPLTDNENWLKWVMVKKEGKEVGVWCQDYPLPYYRPKEKREIPPGARRA